MSRNTKATPADAVPPTAGEATVTLRIDEGSTHKPIQGTGPKPALLTVLEAGALLGIKRTSAWKLVREGVIPTVRFGRVVRVPPDALEHVVKARTRGLPPDGARGAGV